MICSFLAKKLIFNPSECDFVCGKNIFFLLLHSIEFRGVEQETFSRVHLREQTIKYW